LEEAIMNYKKWSIRAIFIIIGLISLIYAIKLEQWKFIKEILTSIIEYESGGLPEAIF